jgi:integrase/recombinase XerD
MANIHGPVDLDKTTETLFSSESPIDEVDYDALEKFIKRCHMENLSDSRIRKYLFQFKRLAELFNYTFTDASREDIEDLIIEVKKYEDWKPSTKRDYRIGIRKFYTVLSDNHNGKGDFPDKVEWISTARKEKNRKDPEEILTKEEIRKLAQATWNKRDEAFILALYESGCRIGEFLPLKIKHFEIDKHGAKISVKGKTGSRRIRIVTSVPAIKSWLENHPKSDDPEAFIWTSRQTKSNPNYKDRHLHDKTVRRRLRKIADKADITKKVNPHAFRHARATHLASELTMAQMTEYFGWSPGSSVPSRYIHLSGRDMDDAILELNGVDTKEEEEDDLVENYECPSCEAKVSPASMFCYECGSPLDTDQESKALEKVMVKFMKEISKENEGVKEKFKEVVKEEKAEDLF